MAEPLLEAFVSILATLITVVGGFAVKNYLIPVLNNKNLTFWVQQAVQAAEKYFDSQPGLGAQKKEFVKDFLAQNLKIKITDDQLDVLIDATVENIVNPIKKEPIAFLQEQPVLPELEVPEDVPVVEEEVPEGPTAEEVVALENGKIEAK